MALRYAQLVKQVQVLGQRNLCISAIAMQKDPIQQLFVNKIRESKRYIVATRLCHSLTLCLCSAKVSGSLEKEMTTELERVAKQYGGGAGVDMTKFPELKFSEPNVDSIDSLNK